MESINEALLDANPIIISFECTKKILEQMKNFICKIRIGNKRGTGFFCKIPFPDKNNIIPVFITNNHVINKLNDEISIYIEGESQERKIFTNSDRMIYMSDENNYDISIIEIKEEDNIKNYLELDEKIINDILNKNNNNKNDKYIDENIYIIQYPEGKLSVSYGILQGLYENKKYDFQHSCSTRLGSSGSPVLNINNNKIIGIHKKGATKFNKGTFISEPIKEFIKKYGKKNKDDNNKNINNINNNIVNFDKVNDDIKNNKNSCINDAIIKYVNKKYNLNIKEINIIELDLSGKNLADEALKALSKIEFKKLKNYR